MKSQIFAVLVAVALVACATEKKAPVVKADTSAVVKKDTPVVVAKDTAKKVDTTKKAVAKTAVVKKVAK